MLCTPIEKATHLIKHVLIGLTVIVHEQKISLLLKMLADTSQQLNDKFYNLYKFDPGLMSTDVQNGQLLHAEKVPNKPGFGNKIVEHCFFSYGVAGLKVKLHGELLIIGVHNFD